MKTGVHYGLDYAVYRTLPTHCHSEICAMVVDATKPLNLSSIVVDSSHAEENSEERVEAIAEDFEPSKCQQGWRHISTLTRVMPVQIPL